NENAGLIRVTAGAKGVFTGTLNLAGKTFVLRGRIDKGGAASFGPGTASTLTIVPKTGPPLALSLQLDVGGGTDKLTGTLTNAGAPYAVIDADRALYSAAKSPKPPYLSVPSGPAGVLGKYTVV